MKIKHEDKEKQKRLRIVPEVLEEEKERQRFIDIAISEQYFYIAYNAYEHQKELEQQKKQKRKNYMKQKKERKLTEEERKEYLKNL
ncbi:MAG: hypothetical protein ACLPWD_06580 [Methanobacterium sp.]